MFNNICENRHLTGLDIELNTVTKIKTILYEQFYNQDTINTLMRFIEDNFNLFNIEFESSNTIKIKIKKTDMKKMASYSCTTEYYYKILNGIFLNFFGCSMNILSNIFNNPINISKYDLNGTELSYFTDPTKTYLFYNITLVLDNIIVIYI